MTKKKFKQKCKAEKAMSYQLMLSGGIVSVIGFIIVVGTMLLTDASVIGYLLGGVIAVIGIALDLTGEAMLSKEFKKYEQS